MLIRAPRKRVILICVCGWHQIDWEQTSFLDHVYLACTQRKCETNQDVVDNCRTMIESRISAGGTEKQRSFGNCEDFYVDLWYGRSCEKVCGTLLLVGEQNNATVVESFHSMPWRQIEASKSGEELSEVCWLCPEMFHLARIGPDIVRSVKLARAITQWTRACDHLALNLIHSFHEWPQATLSCGRFSSNLSLGTVSRFRFCRRYWRFKVDLRWNIVHVCSCLLDVQEADMRVTRLNGIWNYFCIQICAWTVFPHLMSGIWPLIIYIEIQIRITNSRKNGETR